MKSLTASFLLRSLFLLVATVGTVQADEVTSMKRLAKGVVSDNPAAAVALSVALNDAHRLAERKGDKVVRVEGASMLPYFGDGSVLVVKAAKIDALREGMVVLYKNNFGDMVAHRVESRTSEGWTVRGANNSTADSTTVTTANLLGTVYATFYSSPLSRDESVRIVSAAARATDVALAAPAR